MNSKDLNKYIRANNIEAKIIYLEEETPTVADAARVIGVTVEQIGKSLLFLADETPFLVVANGTTRVKYKILANFMGINRRQLKLANPDQVKSITGYQVGTVPPFGHKKTIMTLLEENIRFQTELYVGGGEINALMHIAVPDLEKKIGAKYVNLLDN